VCVCVCVREREREREREMERDRERGSDLFLAHLSNCWLLLHDSVFTAARLVSCPTLTVFPKWKQRIAYPDV